MQVFVNEKREGCEGPLKIRKTKKNIGMKDRLKIA